MGNDHRIGPDELTNDGAFAFVRTRETPGPRIRGSHLLTSRTETKNGAARTPFCSILATLWLQFRADVSGCYRGNVDLWLPDQGSNLGPAD